MSDVNTETPETELLAFEPDFRAELERQERAKRLEARTKQLRDAFFAVHHCGVRLGSGVVFDVEEAAAGGYTATYAFKVGPFTVRDELHIDDVFAAHVGLPVHNFAIDAIRVLGHFAFLGDLNAQPKCAACDGYGRQRSKAPQRRRPRSQEHVAIDKVEMLAAQIRAIPALTVEQADHLALTARTRIPQKKKAAS